jgi:hypothetical protein
MIVAAAGYATGVILLATVVRTALGFGEALVAVPLLALYLPIVVATPLAVCVSIIVALLVIARDWRHVELRSVAWLLLASFIGIPVGIHLIAHVDDHLVKLLLGALIAAFGVYAIRGASSVRMASDSLAWLCGAGLIAGIMGGAYGMNGPPLAIYGTMRGWPPQRFRATLQAYFLVASLAGLLGYFGVGLVTPVLGSYLLWSLPAVAAGVVLGRMIAARISHDRFVHAVYVGLVTIGLLLIAEAMLKRV